MKAYLFLAGAIMCEVLATSFLKASDQFTKLGPSLITVIGYLSAFFLLSYSLKTLPVGTAYALWSGLGTVAVLVVSVIFFKQRLDGAAVAGVALIVGGVLLLTLVSKTAPH